MNKRQRKKCDRRRLERALIPASLYTPRRAKRAIRLALRMTIPVLLRLLRRHELLCRYVGLNPRDRGWRIHWQEVSRERMRRGKVALTYNVSVEDLEPWEPVWRPGMETSDE